MAVRHSGAFVNVQLDQIASFSGVLLRLSRPRQWAKNLVVLAPAAANGTLFSGWTLMTAGAMTLLWCLASAGAYYQNDAIDAEADRLHPLKWHRPVASEQITPNTALLAGVFLHVLAVGGAILLREPTAALLLGAYMVLSMAYTVALKRLVGLDVLTIAVGFVLRLLSGAAAADVPISGWLLSATVTAAVVVAVGKRLSDRAGEFDGETGLVGARWSRGHLVLILNVSIVALVVQYGAWITTRPAGPLTGLVVLSVAPLALLMARFRSLAVSGLAGSPERLPITDRPVAVALTAWLVLAVAGSIRLHSAIGWR